MAFLTEGCWEGSVVIEVVTRSLRARDDLVEIIGMIFAEITVDPLYNVGLIVKPPQIGSPSETEDRNEILEKHLTSTTPTVLVSPSMMSGIDLKDGARKAWFER